MSVTVVVAGDGAAWESALLDATGDQDLGVSVVRRCMDVVELVSVALSGQARVALVAGRLRDLDAGAVDQLLAAGVVPVAVLHGNDAHEIDAVRARGISHAVSSDADPTVVARVVIEAAQAADASDADISLRRAYSLPGSDVQRPSGREPDSAHELSASGRVIAVWGPTGAPGRTTVATALADEIARLGATSVLVDADVYGGTAATRLGVLDESPGLAAACRIASTTRLVPATLAELSWQLGPRLRLLTGIPLAQRWPELRPTAVQTVLSVARAVAQWVVVDLGFSIESDEELAYDALVPRRNGATTAVLDVADVVLVVGEADPVGLQRLAHALLELGESVPSADVHVVLNKVRPSFGPGDAASASTATLARFTSREPAACLPFDQDATDAATAIGRSLAEVRPRSHLRQCLRQLALDLTGIEPPRSRRHAKQGRKVRRRAG